MIQKKVCMLGAFAVGKTSLVARYVRSVFSEKYLTTVGVKVDKKDLTVDERQISLLLWDINGHDDYQAVQQSYLRGTSGYLLVVDGTRRATLETVSKLQQVVEAVAGAGAIRGRAQQGGSRARVAGGRARTAEDRRSRLADRAHQRQDR